MILPSRQRLPARRPAITEEIEAGGVVLTVTVGFDPATGQPRELFLSGGKTGSTLDAILDDAAVAISVALQHGITASAMCKSVARIPESIDGPPMLAASPIGAALDLIGDYEVEI